MKSFYPIALSCTAAVMMSACSHIPAVALDTERLADDAMRAFDTRPVPTQLPPAPRPSYGRGDTFIYGTTSLFRVTAVRRSGFLSR